MQSNRRYLHKHYRVVQMRVQQWLHRCVFCASASKALQNIEVQMEHTLYSTAFFSDHILFAKVTGRSPVLPNLCDSQLELQDSLPLFQGFSIFSARGFN